MSSLRIKQTLEEEPPQQQLAVLLTLAGNSSQVAGVCPTPESLAALVDGKAQYGQRAALLEHLDRCQECYRIWLRVAALQSPQSVGNVLFFRRAPYLSAFATLALAASLVLVLVRWDPFAPDLPGMLELAYQATVSRGVPNVPDRALPSSLLGQKEIIALGFSDPTPPVAVKQAFAAGVNTGWEALSNQVSRSSLAKPVDKEWEVYYHLGRWTFLLQTLCQATPPPTVTLLRQQAEIGRVMGVALAGRKAVGEVEARVPSQETDGVVRLLDTPDSEEPAHRLCRQIRKSCATIAESLLL